MHAWAWRLYLALGFFATVIYFQLSSPTTVSLWYITFSMMHPIFIILSVRLNHPADRISWYLLALGAACWWLADLIWTYHDIVLQSSAPFPSLADAFYLSGYAVVASSLVSMQWRRLQGRDLASLVDALIIATGVGVLAWVFLIEPYARDQSLSLAERLVSLAYPLSDVLILAVLLRLLFAVRLRSRSFLCLTAGMFLFLVADTFYVTLVLQGLYTLGHLIDAGWMIGMTLIVVSALHPSMRDTSAPDQVYLARLTRGRFPLITIALLLAPIALIIQTFLGGNIDALIIAGGSIALSVLILVRMHILIRMLEAAMLHLRQIVRREHTLRQIGQALVAAVDQERVYIVVVDGAFTLIDHDPNRSVALALGSIERMEIKQAAGASFETMRGAAIAPQQLPAHVRSALLDGRAVGEAAWDDATVRASFGCESLPRTLFLAPLFMQGELKGLIIVAGDALPSQSKRYALESLAVDATLALESLARARELHRRQSEARLAALVQNASDVISIIDATGVVRYVSPSVERLLGYTPQECIGDAHSELIHPDDHTRLKAFFATLRTGVTPVPPLEARLRRCDGTWMYVEILGSNLLHDPNVGGILLNTRDITERKALEQRLAFQAYHDPLTNLPNRALLADRVQHALARSIRQQRPIALLFLDLDRFKLINDSLGHDAGDQLLIAVADRLNAHLRPEDTLARLGGDEFVVLLEDINDDMAAVLVAERLLQLMREPFLIQGQHINISASIGVVLSAPQDTDPSDLLRYADIAMYEAKNAGKARYAVFDRSATTIMLQQLKLEGDLRRAIEHRQIQVYYQPIVNLASGAIVGVEALARWIHPEQGMVPPQQFIPLAEETGLIVPLGRLVLEEACRQARYWQTTIPGATTLEICVNVSARQMHHSDLVADVLQILRDVDLAPESLKLELTEGILMEESPSVTDNMRALHEHGVRFAIDDFGTGYSSLSYLKRFPVDTLKIDRTFICGLSADAEDSAIVDAIISLARTLGLMVVAEGVETHALAAKLLERGCLLGQGFYFAGALPAAEMEQLLARQRSVQRREVQPPAMNYQQTT